MKYLTGEDILVIHARIIEETGGLHGVRDTHLFLSIIERPKIKVRGVYMHKTVFDKAALYLEALVHYHVFIDGNKRTSLAVALRFLSINGYEIIAANDEVEKFVLDVVARKIDSVGIAYWFKSHLNDHQPNGLRSNKKTGIQ